MNIGEFKDMHITEKTAAVKKPSTSDISTPEIPAPEVRTVQTPVHPSRSATLPPVQVPQTPRTRPATKRLADSANAAALQEQCRQICLSIFFHGCSSVRSLGITSSINGEGKTFLTVIMANVLANDISNPVISLECNWEHPCFHEYFGIPSTPGLAEWLRGECSEADIRHSVDPNLTVIPSGNGNRDAVKLLQQIQQKGLLGTFAHSNELLVVDLPSIVTSAYGSLAAGLLESLLIVVRAGVVSDAMVAETYTQLQNLPVQGVVLNQVTSRIPRWIRQIL